MQIKAKCLNLSMEHQIVFFDGVCNLCAYAVRFIIRRDLKDRFRFVALQSEAARTLLQGYQLAPGEADTILLLKEGQLYQQSAAVLHIAAGLSGGWPLLRLFLPIPTFIRDLIYRVVAHNRYRFLGRKKECLVPTPALQSKFL